MHTHSSACGGHHHAPQKYDIKFAFGIVLNVVFIAVEVFYAKISSSSALMADALHNFYDVIGLVLSWFGIYLAKFKKTPNLTFALKNATIIAAFLNAILLIMGVVYILIEAFQSLIMQNTVIPQDIIIVAGIGIVINGLTAALFLSGAKDDINIKSAFLHMLSDALVSAGVVIGGVIILYTGFFAVDAILTFIIAAVILLSGWGLLKESTRLVFNGVPSAVSLKEVEMEILSFKGVVSMHDLHIWALSTSQNAISFHVTAKDGFETRALIKVLKTKFKLHHFTIQAEKEGEFCEDAC